MDSRPPIRVRALDALAELPVCVGMKRRVLIAFECSGIVREQFLKLSWDAWSCDLKPSEKLGPHIQGDAFNAMGNQGPWDLMIAHPPCTHLAVSGARWWTDKTELRDDAIRAFNDTVFAPIPHICVENPIGVMSTLYRKPDQIIQPYDFGHDASKSTCLWLKDLPKLRETGPYIKPRIVDGKKRWGNQTDSGQNRLGPSPERATIRSRTYYGIAKAMAEQWTEFFTKLRA